MFFEVVPSLHFHAATVLICITFNSSPDKLGVFLFMVLNINFVSYNLIYFMWSGFAHTVICVFI